ncbi:MAG: tetratricopeptide repeat protein [Candidatus Heimdallarchaeota archaeon]|nr:tetratricopeptide repeat protein [Candidatus Heimdallarchaeota archaeon]MCK4877672.1 tetratricopeptide repeat protein [Candidatus Heimdallarchaeota archaeon]
MSSKNEEKLEELSKMFLGGQYYEVLNQLDEILEKTESSAEEKIKTKILKGRVLFHIAWFDYNRDYSIPSLTILKEAYDESKKINNKLLEFESIHWMYLPLWDLNEFKEFNEFFTELGILLDEIESSFPSEFKHRKAQFLVWKGFLSHFKLQLGMEVSSTIVDEIIQSVEQSMQFNLELGNQDDLAYNYRQLAICYRMKGDLVKSLEFWEKALKISLEWNNKYITAFVYCYICDVHAQMGELNLSEELFQKANNLYEELDSERGLFQTKYLKAGLHLYKGERNEALELYEECLTFFLEENYREKIAECYTQIGNILYLQWGKLEKSFEYLTKAYRIYVELGDPKVPSISWSISEVHLLKGELDEALKIREEVLNYCKQGGNIFAISGYLAAIAEVYWHKGMLKEALEYTKESLKLREEKNLKWGIYASHSLIVILAVESNNAALAENHLEKVRSIIDELSTKPTEQYFRYLQALVLKLSKKISDLIQAEVLLEQLLKEEINYRLLIDSLLCLCEILIKQLLQTDDKEVLKKLSKYVSKLFEFAESSDAFPLIVEILWLQSQILLIEADVKEAQQFLAKANLIAKEKGLVRLEKKISFEEKEFKRKADQIANLAEIDSSLSKRMEIIGITKTVTDIKKERLIDIQQEQHVVGNKLFSIKI